MGRFTTPAAQLRISASIIITSIIGWPLSALTVARDEPFVILSISWLALIYSGYSAFVAALVDKRLAEQNGD